MASIKLEDLGGAVAILPTQFKVMFDEGDLQTGAMYHFMYTVMPVWKPEAVIIGGELGEARSMTIDERLQEIAELQDYLEKHQKDMPYIIGVSSLNDRMTITLAQEASKDSRCIGVMFAPHTSCAGNVEAIIRSIKKLDKYDVVLQDDPKANGVDLTVSQITQICKACPNIKAVKEEGEGTSNRIRQLRKNLGKKIRLFGGLSGADLVNEMDAGADGVMTGTAFFEILVQLLKLTPAKRAKQFEKIQPLFLADKIGLVPVRKAILGNRFGVSQIVREPLQTCMTGLDDLYQNYYRLLPEGPNWSKEMKISDFNF